MGFVQRPKLRLILGASDTPYVDEPEYCILTDDEENKGAVAALFETLDKRSPREGTVKLGFPGDNVGPVTAKYDKNANLWWYHDKDYRPYYWNSFGYGEPQWDGSVAATVEFSISKQYAKGGRKIEGAMVRDSGGAVYLAHTGVLKGGRVKPGFREYHANKKGRGNHIVARDDRGNRKLILITNIRGPNASKDIAEYVKVAKEYKQGPGRRESSGASTDEQEYCVLTDDEENRNAVRTLFESLGKLAAPVERRVNLTSHPGGYRGLEVIYDKKSKIWWYKDPDLEGYYWNYFGYGDPLWYKRISATVKFGIPMRYAKDGRTTAGAMVKDSKGTVYLAHTGRLDQNAKSGFEGYHANKKGRSKHVVARDDESVRGLILVTEIEGPDVSKNIADYLSVVEKYKRGPGRKEYLVLDGREIDEHNQRFRDNLKDKDTETIEVMNLGRSDDAVPVRDAKYNKAKNIWWWSGRGSQDNSYRNCFGVGKPKQTGADSMASSGDNPTHSMVTNSIAVEINFPRSREDRMVDGALIEGDGKVYVTHSGRLDKRGEGSGFNAYCGRKYDWIEADDGMPDKRSLVLISSIDDPDLLGRVAGFVTDMSRLNDEPKGGPVTGNPDKPNGGGGRTDTTNRDGGPEEDEQDTPNGGGPKPEGEDGRYTIKSIIDDGCFLEEERLEAILDSLEREKNLILQGPPGTGKTWLAKKLAFALIRSKDKRRVQHIQLHPNLSYEDFVRGYRPGGGGKLELVDGPFLEMVKRAREDRNTPHAFVIEEINRGNPAQIFGELLTLLESDKRNGDYALSLAYPRDGEAPVFLPDNLYVIGTMNLSDRSLAMIDMALRRRFAFEDLEPVFNDKWEDWVKKRGVPDYFVQRIKKGMQDLNAKISKDESLGRQYRIGHSYVTPGKDEVIDDHKGWFKSKIEKKIGPLLDEYWFDDQKKAKESTEALLDISR